MLFLGHHGDRDDAAELARRLQGVGVEVWCSALDDRESGGAYHEELIPAIKRASCFVALLGEKGQGGELTDEVHRAMAEKGKCRDYRIVPVALPSAPRTPEGLLANPSDELEIYLPPIWLAEDWRTKDEDFFRRMARGRLGQTLASPPVLPPLEPAPSSQPTHPEPLSPKRTEAHGEAEPQLEHMTASAEVERPGAPPMKRAFPLGTVVQIFVIIGFFSWVSLLWWEPRKEDPGFRPWVSNELTPLLGTRPDPLRTDRLPLQMVRILKGSFVMGDSDSPQSDERPAHTVTVRAFELSAFEVTREQYRAVMKGVPGAHIPEEDWKAEEERWRKADLQLSAAELARLPATHVSWVDAIHFCNALSEQSGMTPYYTPEGEPLGIRASAYRLPSEAEWEYACRSGEAPEAEYGFASAADLRDYCWYFANSGVAELKSETAWDAARTLAEWGCRPHSVGTRTPSAWRHHDMHGNVWEWCEDAYESNYEKAPTNGNSSVGERSWGRVIRGGSFGLSAERVRSAARGEYYNSDRARNLGFRPARSVTAN